MATLDYTGKSVDAGRIGAAVEHLVAASCVLASNAELNVSTSLVDDEGVDLVFHRRGSSTTVAVQVKARSSDTSVVERGSYTAFVRTATFRPRPELFMLFVVVDRPTATIRDVWWVPSVDFDLRAGTTNRATRRFVASVKAGANDQWRAYRMPFADLPAAILRQIDQLAGAR
ncbi:MAG: hypothetical protein CVU47_05985 [Chloroflexi bacterium HGW-Chloroflexi-9]|nr:MAG: hypothetical protein CVU47_05985 [Chloroflexi bacterium HGW-Chloroflexi-9]